MVRFRFQFWCGFQNPKLKPNRFLCYGSVSKSKPFQNRKTKPFGAVRFDSCFGSKCPCLMASNPVFHARTRHMEVDYHYICEKDTRHELQVGYIATQDQVADFLTKGLSTYRFNYLLSKLPVRRRPLNLRGVINKVRKPSFPPRNPLKIKTDLVNRKS